MKTKVEFLAWLKSLPEDTKFCDKLRINTCPIAKFTGEPAYSRSLGNPAWVNEFISRYDSKSGRDLGLAVTIAEELVHDELY